MNSELNPISLPGCENCKLSCPWIKSVLPFFNKCQNNFSSLTMSGQYSDRERELPQKLMNESLFSGTIWFLRNVTMSNSSLEVIPTSRSAARKDHQSQWAQQKGGPEIPIFTTIHMANSSHFLVKTNVHGYTFKGRVLDTLFWLRWATG